MLLQVFSDEQMEFSRNHYGVHSLFLRNNYEHELLLLYRNHYDVHSQSLWRSLALFSYTLLIFLNSPRNCKDGISERIQNESKEIHVYRRPDR